MPYIHARPNWPNLKWDDAQLSPLLAAVRHQQGRLLGRMEGLGFQLRAEASLTEARAHAEMFSTLVEAHEAGKRAFDMGDAPSQQTPSGAPA